MSDTEAATDAAKVMEIMITKAKKVLAVSMSNIPDDMFEEIVYRGLSDVLNSGMSKILTKDLEGEELEKAKTAAFEKAEENLKELMASKVKHKGARATKATKVSREVNTEALRLARDIIKDQIRADGGKPSHYKASDITKWAKELIEADPSFLAQATANIEARKAKPIAISLSGLKPDAELVKKDDARKAKNKVAKGQLSAKQAGKVAPPRSKPKAGEATAH